jgi:hypothetical protein
MPVTSNGRHAEDASSPESMNPYAEAVAGDRPPELIRYDLNTDPYANVIPNPNRFSQEDNLDGDVPQRRRNPLMVAVSLTLIVILVLPVMAEVFSRLFR